MAAAVPKALESGSGYLWSPMRNGGEFMMVPNSLGGERKVVTERNILPVGKKVTKKELEASDEQWEEWVLSGVIRDYEYPEMPAGSSESPLTFLQRKINEASQSEEERLVAAVQGATSSDEALAAAGTEAQKQAEKDAKAEEKK